MRTIDLIYIIIKITYQNICKTTHHINKIMNHESINLFTQYMAEYSINNLNRYNFIDSQLYIELNNKQSPIEEMHLSNIPNWIHHKPNNDYGLFNPYQIEDLELKNFKYFQIIMMQPSTPVKIFQDLQTKGIVFEDPQFQPNDKCLCRGQKKKDWKNIQWKKLTECFSGSQRKIFTTKELVSPSHITQGRLGDCYFLAALAALAEVPARITQLFLLQQVNDQKYFSVKLLYCGKWTRIDLDQMVPFSVNKNNKHQPAFSHSNDKGLWVILLQKAWAKLYKSYKQIQEGQSQQALHDLTGAPVKTIFLNIKKNNQYRRYHKFDQQKGWNYLVEASQKNYAMVCSSMQQTKGQIEQGHAYTFLHACQIRLKDKSTQRIIKLRNPWGENAFKGKWWNKDSIWKMVSRKQKKKAQLEQNIEDKGTFFMSYENFLDNFTYIEIAEIVRNASYVYESYPDEEQKGVYFTLRIFEEAEYSLQIDKTPQRSLPPKKQSQYRYSPAHIILKKIQDNDKKKVSQQIFNCREKKRPKRTFYQKELLQPGKYVALVRIDWNRQFEQNFRINLAVYAKYICGIYISSDQDAKQFTQNPETRWNGQLYKYILKPGALKKIDEVSENIIDVIARIKQNLNTSSGSKSYINFFANLINKNSGKGQQYGESYLIRKKQQEEKITSQEDLSQQEQSQKNNQINLYKLQKNPTAAIPDNPESNSEQHQKQKQRVKVGHQNQFLESVKLESDQKQKPLCRKKVLQKYEKTTISQKSQIYNSREQNQVPYKTTCYSAIEQKLTSEYKNRNNLRKKIRQNMNEKQVKEVIQNGRIHHKITIKQQRILTSEDIHGTIKRQILSKNQNVQEFSDSDNNQQPQKYKLDFSKGLSAYVKLLKMEAQKQSKSKQSHN